MSGQQATKYTTLNVNAIGAKNPTVVAQAAARTLRVVVRNVGAGIVFLSGSPGELDPVNGPSTGTFRLPAGDEEVFVVQPKDSLLALAIGAGAFLSVSTSEANPLEYLRS